MQQSMNLLGISGVAHETVISQGPATWLWSVCSCSTSPGTAPNSQGSSGEKVGDATVSSAAVALVC